MYYHILEHTYTQTDCVEPKCNFSKRWNKCTKPNPYIEAVAWCKRNKKNHEECKDDYNKNKTNATLMACKRYYERIALPKKLNTVGLFLTTLPPGAKVINSTPYIIK